MFEGKNYVNGEWQEHQPDFSSLNPCTEIEVGLFQYTEGRQVDEAVDAARCAFDSWRSLSRVKRGEYLDKLAQIVKANTDRLVDVISLETGKSKNESYAEVIEALHAIQYSAGSARMPFGEVIASEISDKDAYMLRKPKGVVAIVSPWNFPIAIAAAWQAAPALVEGNTVVWKPSEYTPMCAQVMTELFAEAGFPPGVFNLIHGMDKTGEQLVHNQVDCILFTGSAEVGKLIRQHCANTWHKTCACEMGSKSAVVVFDDANMDLAIDACIASAFKLSGQRCVSSGRMIVQRNIAEEFASKFIDRAESLVTGDPFSEDIFYGPLINSYAVEKVEAYNDMARSSDEVSVFSDGGPLKGPGYFMSPFVYGGEWCDVPFFKEEVFGPHVGIIPFDEVDDAIHIYNDTDYGLAVGVITDDFRIARRCRDKMDYGMCYWNGGSIAAESHVCFGGVKKSGNGWPSASRTFRAVTHEVAWTVNHEEGLSFPQGMK